MMNTRKLAEKTLKAVKDGINAAISQNHSKLQGNVFKAAEQVEVTSKALRCRSSEIMVSTKTAHHSGTSSETVFLSNNHLPNEKNGWNTHFSQPLNIRENHIYCALDNCSSPASVVTGSSSGIATISLGARYGKNLMMQQRMMSTRAVNANRGTIEGIITTLNDKFNADIVNDTQAIYQFNILSGDRREIYYIDLRNGSGSAGKGKSEGSPDTIFSIDAENFNRLVEGNLRAPTAFMTGKMKISGSMQKAAKLEKLFATLLNK